MENDKTKDNLSFDQIFVVFPLASITVFLILNFIFNKSLVSSGLLALLSYYVTLSFYIMFKYEVKFKKK